MKKVNTKLLTLTALFAAVASALMFFEFPLPLMPPFLKIDLSTVAIVLCLFVVGMKPAIFALGVKDIIHALSTKSGGVGELADFIMSLSFLLLLYFFYRKSRDKKGVLQGVAAGTASMGIVGMLTNYFLLIPFYSKIIMPMDQILSLCQSINPAIHDMKTYIVFGVLPFNLIKGVILSIVIVLIYPRLQAIIARENNRFRSSTAS